MESGVVRVEANTRQEDRLLELAWELGANNPQNARLVDRMAAVEVSNLTLRQPKVIEAVTACLDEDVQPPLRAAQELSARLKDLLPKGDTE